MKTKSEIIAAIAMTCSKLEQKMKVTELADILNKIGVRTSYDTEFEGGRGTYTLVSHAYNYWYEKDDEIAEIIAGTFVKEDGTFAYEH